MKFNKKVKLLFHKTYFDTGYSLTSYAKYVLAIVGIGSAIQGFSLWAIIFFGLIYGVLCYVLGYLWVKYKWTTAQMEVHNELNLFMREMRSFARKNGRKGKNER